MQNPEQAVALMDEMRRLGVRLAMDDFGIGYSSIGHLKRFPIDSLKLDRTFVRDLPDDINDVAITRAVIAMAHTLRIGVIAEGVERQAQLDAAARRRLRRVPGLLLPAAARAGRARSVRARQRNVRDVRRGLGADAATGAVAAARRGSGGAGDAAGAHCRRRYGRAVQARRALGSLCVSLTIALHGPKRMDARRATQVVARPTNQGDRRRRRRFGLQPLIRT